MAASHHKVAAVSSPLIFPLSFKITPAPKKPIPDTTCAAILETSLALVRSEKLTKRKESRHTKTFVLRPITLLRHCLSRPIAKPKAKVTIILNKKS